MASNSPAVSPRHRSTSVHRLTNSYYATGPANHIAPETVTSGIDNSPRAYAEASSHAMRQNLYLDTSVNNPDGSSGRGTSSQSTSIPHQLPSLFSSENGLSSYSNPPMLSRPSDFNGYSYGPSETSGPDSSLSSQPRSSCGGFTSSSDPSNFAFSKRYSEDTAARNGSDRAPSDVQSLSSAWQRNDSSAGPSSYYTTPSDSYFNLPNGRADFASGSNSRTASRVDVAAVLCNMSQYGNPDLTIPKPWETSTQPYGHNDYYSSDSYGFGPPPQTNGHRQSSSAISLPSVQHLTAGSYHSGATPVEGTVPSFFQDQVSYAHIPTYNNSTTNGDHPGLASRQYGAAPPRVINGNRVGDRNGRGHHELNLNRIIHNASNPGRVDKAIRRTATNGHDPEATESDRERLPGMCHADPECKETRNMRSAISHFFGRNKNESKSLPELRTYQMCRKHYQRCKYSGEKTMQYAQTQCRYIHNLLDVIEQRDSHLRWRIEMSKGLKDTYSAELARERRGEPPPMFDADDKGASMWKQAQVVKRPELQRFWGSDRSFDDVRHFLNIVLRIMPLEGCTDLPRVEFLPPSGR